MPTEELTFEIATLQITQAISGATQAAPTTAMLHPNGFEKILLQRRSNGQRVYLHYWPRPSYGSHIHGHNWDFTSVVLLGSLTNEIFTESAEPTSERSIRVRQMWHIGTSEPLANDPEQFSTAVRPAAAVDYHPGDTYSQRAEILHRVRTVARTATVVLREAPRLRRSPVLLTQADLERPWTAAEHLPLSHVQRRLHQIAERLT